MYISKIAEDILAERLLSYGAVTFYKDAPLRLKSGLVTPIYVDNRKLTAWPDAWHDVIETMASRIDQLKLDFDVVAGVEGAGVSHSAALAYRLYKPSIFVRESAKTYGNKLKAATCRASASSSSKTTSRRVSRFSPPSKPSRRKAPA